MKRSAPLKRAGFLKRQTRIAKVNPERHAKRVARYRKGLAASRKGAGRREALARAGGRCERLLVVDVALFAGAAMPTWERCPITDADAPLQAHHLTYARFGGAELPEDYLVVCPRCHAEIESGSPTRRHGRAL